MSKEWQNLHIDDMINQFYKVTKMNIKNANNTALYMDINTIWLKS